MENTPSAIKDRLSHYTQYVIITAVAVLLIVGGVSLWRFIFPKKDTQANNPKVVVTPFARVDAIDQTNTQIDMSEKPWEVGIGVGVVQYDNKAGMMAGAFVKRRW